MTFHLKHWLVVVLLFASVSAFAEGSDVMYVVVKPLNVLQLFTMQTQLNKDSLPDYVKREADVTECISDYVKRQSKSYSKVVQNNLYDLIHNFNRVVSRIHNNKAPLPDSVSYTEKIIALGQIQCNAYYAIGALE